MVPGFTDHMILLWTLSSHTTNKSGHCITGVTPVQMVSSMAQEEEVNADMLRVGCSAAHVCLPLITCILKLCHHHSDHPNVMLACARCIECQHENSLAHAGSVVCFAYASPTRLSFVAKGNKQTSRLQTKSCALDITVANEQSMECANYCLHIRNQKHSGHQEQQIHGLLISRWPLICQR